MSKPRTPRFPLVFCGGAAGGWSGSPGSFRNLNRSCQIIPESNQILQCQNDASPHHGARIIRSRKHRGGVPTPMRKRQRG
jgi:hypothetical protein